MQKNILEYLEYTVQTFPNKIAIVDEKNTISFVRVHSLVNLYDVSAKITATPSAFNK